MVTFRNFRRPYFLNQFLGRDFFAASYSNTALDRMIERIKIHFDYSSFKNGRDVFPYFTPSPERPINKIINHPTKFSPSI